MTFQLLEKAASQAVPENEWIERSLPELEVWEREQTKGRALGKKGRPINPRERLYTIKRQWEMFQQWKSLGILPD